MTARRSSTLKLAAGFLWLATACLMAATVVSLFATADWRAMLVTHFRPYLAVLCLLMAGVSLGLRAGLQNMLMLGCFVISAWPVATAWASKAPFTTVQDKPLRVASFNVFFANDDLDALHAVILKSSADVIFLSELTPLHEPLTKALARDYRYQVFPAAQGGQGEALFSKYPLRDPGRTAVNSSSSLWHVSLAYAGHDVLLLGGHPLPALNEQLDAMQQAWFAAVETALVQRQQGQVTLVLGDFNATPWSPRLARLLAKGKLRWVGDGLGTWPARWPRWLGLPIDHILLSDEWLVSAVTYAGSAGSDHRMLVADLALPR